MAGYAQKTFHICVWDVAKGKVLAIVEHPSSVGSRPGGAVYSRGGNLLLAKGSEILVRAPNSAAAISAVAIPTGLHFEAFSHDGEHIAWTDTANTVVITDSRAEKRIAELKGHEGKVECVVFSADGMRVATGSSDGTILIWDLARCPKPADK